MGISVEQWRASIGSFIGNQRKSRISGPVSDGNTCIRRIAVVISILLLISCVETNPGPPKKQNAGSNIETHDFKDILEKIYEKLHRIDDLDNKLDVLNTNVRSMEVWQTQVSENITQIFDENKGLKEAVQNLAQENQKLKEENIKMQARLTDYEGRSRRCNLLFYGINKSKQRESWEESELKVRKLVTEKLQMNGDEVEINRAHRIHNGAIIVNFLRFKDKEAILRAKGKLRDTDFSIGEDYPRPIREKRRLMMDLTKAHRDSGKQVILKYDKVLIEKQLYTVNEESKLVLVSGAKKSRRHHSGGSNTD